MPLLRALARWLQGLTTDDQSLYSDTRYRAGTAVAVIGCFATLAAIVAFPVTLVVGGAYELVRRIDRANVLGDRGHWLVAMALAIGVALAAYLAWRASG